MAYEVRDQYGVLTVTEPDSPREIRFITPEYREQFRIRDGESVLLSARTISALLLSDKFL